MTQEELEREKKLARLYDQLLTAINGLESECEDPQAFGGQIVTKSGRFFYTGDCWNYERQF